MNNTSTSYKYPLYLLGLWLAVALLVIFLSIWAADGHLVYSLDDPYIHLALADNILKGGYGINANEYSAPSSSMIYAFLLAGTQSLGLGDWGPLVINFLAMAAAVFVVGIILRDFILPGMTLDVQAGKLSRYSVALGLAMCALMNSWALIMTGMEHSLHLLAAMLVVLGLLKIARHDTVTPRWLIAAIVALPMIRFEGIAMSLLSILALWYLGRRKAALIAAVLVILILIGWSQFMQSLGLPIMPSSVQLKSDIVSNATTHTGSLFKVLHSIGLNLAESMRNRKGSLLALMLIFVVGFGVNAWQNKPDRRLILVIGGMSIFSGLAHLFFGKFTGFSRYEIYILSFVALSALVIGRDQLKSPGMKLGVVFGLLLISIPYLNNTYRTPLASRNIYQQQYQMHRFAIEYWKKPVAVNDLGWVSYHNPSYVLDLWGLGSEEVRKMKLLGDLSAESLQKITDKKNVNLIMIYDIWYKNVPSSWTKVAELKTSQVSAADGTVSFYVTPKVDLLKIRMLLQQFAKTLPSGASLVIEPDSPPGCRQ